ncbi:MAG TPA: AraC family transcriptional regulator [Candidatus Dormibacteraeota bacterium]
MGTAAPDDGMSQLLLRMSVSSTVYCLSEMSSPWGFRVAARPSPVFHLLTAGSAWLVVEGVSDGIRVHAGDLVIMPKGNGHSLKDSPDSRILWLDDILAASPPVGGRLTHGGGGERAELVCGGFAIDQLTARPLLETLPRVLHLRGHEGRAPEWLSGLIRMISVEMAANAAGAEAVVTRLSDALLAQALRAHLLEAGAGARPPVRDVQVARALRLMRERPGEHWSVTSLAAAVGLSRSAFAQRFRAATGEAPMQSLTRHRLAQAANYLRTTDAGLREIAARTGYESEVSISKAFRRVYGTSPGAYRKSLTGAA